MRADDIDDLFGEDRKRSNSLPNSSPRFFPAAVLNGAILMLHCSSSVPYKVLSNKVSAKGYQKSVIPKEHYDENDFSKTFSKIDHSNCGLFILEANYGFTGAAKANAELIKYVCEYILKGPTKILILYSATQPALKDALEKCEEIAHANNIKLLPLLAGSPGKVFEEVPQLRKSSSP